jgi:hypothetical protein
MTAQRKLWWWCLVALLGCDTIDAGGEAKGNEAPPDDPLNIEDALDPASFDAIHRDVILPSCASTENFCHFGQFEPNLSTPALAYASLVRRPGIELFDRYRVTPGNPDMSLIIDKLRAREGVATQMPLGAPPLAEDAIARLEQWIRDGARRYPGAPDTPTLNEPPYPPEMGIFDAMGTRLDSAGAALVQVGQTITLRHSVKDYETPDASIPYGAVLLQLDAGQNVVLDPEYPDGTTPTVFDASGPEGVGDTLNWRLDWVIPDTITVTDGVSTQTMPSAGLTFRLIALYLDGLPATGGILTFQFQESAVTVEGGGS